MRVKFTLSDVKLLAVLDQLYVLVVLSDHFFKSFFDKKVAFESVFVDGFGLCVWLLKTLYVLQFYRVHFLVNWMYRKPLELLER